MRQAAEMLNPAYLVNTVFTADGELYEVVGGIGMKPGKRL